MYSDPRFLADMTEEVRKWIDRNMENPAITRKNACCLNVTIVFYSYFENDVLEYVVMKDKEGGRLPVLYPQGHKNAGKQIVNNKKDKFIGGAKKYVTDISMNAMLSQLLVAKDDQETLDLDTFLNDGGILFSTPPLQSSRNLVSCSDNLSSGKCNLLYSVALKKRTVISVFRYSSRSMNSRSISTRHSKGCLRLAFL